MPGLPGCAWPLAARAPRRPAQRSAPARRPPAGPAPRHDAASATLPGLLRHADPAQAPLGESRPCTDDTAMLDCQESATKVKRL